MLFLKLRDHQTADEMFWGIWPFARMNLCHEVWAGFQSYEGQAGSSFQGYSGCPPHSCKVSLFAATIRYEP